MNTLAPRTSPSSRPWSVLSVARAVCWGCSQFGAHQPGQGDRLVGQHLAVGYLRSPAMVG